MPRSNMVTTVCINRYLHRDPERRLQFFYLGIRHRCSEVFSPVVENWIGSPSVNLLAVELLYLAFSLCLLRYPKLLGDDERITQSPFGIIQDPLRDLINPITDASILKSQAANGSRKRKAETQSQSPRPSSSPPSLQKQEGGSSLLAQPALSPQPLFVISQQQKPALPEPDCAQQLESVRPSVSPLFLLDKLADPHLQSNVQLRSWVSELESLSEEQRWLIWATCAMLPQWPGGLAADSFKKVIEFWSNNVQQYQVAIKILFSVIGYLKYQGGIPVSANIHLLSSLSTFKPLFQPNRQMSARR